MGNRAAKGSAFERQFCRDLSLWWSNGEDSDLFWRTSNSGGRATTRTKRGLKTRSHYGDVLATDEVGKPFTDFFCLELKRGYNRHSIADLLDRPPKVKKFQLYEEWIRKVKRTQKVSGSHTWMLVVRRDKREPVVFLSTRVFEDLSGAGIAPLQLRTIYTGNSVSGIPLQDFFDEVKPKQIKLAVSYGYREKRVS